MITKGISLLIVDNLVSGSIAHQPIKLFALRIQKLKTSRRPSALRGEERRMINWHHLVFLSNLLLLVNYAKL